MIFGTSGPIFPNFMTNPPFLPKSHISRMVDWLLVDWLMVVGWLIDGCWLSDWWLLVDWLMVVGCWLIESIPIWHALSPEVEGTTTKSRRATPTTSSNGTCHWLDDCCLSGWMVQRLLFRWLFGGCWLLVDRIHSNMARPLSRSRGYNYQIEKGNTYNILKRHLSLAWWLLLEWLNGSTVVVSVVVRWLLVGWSDWVSGCWFC